MKAFALGCLCAASALLAASGAPAQTYPAKPMRVIIPASAGDSCDTLTRLIAPKLAGVSAIRRDMQKWGKLARDIGFKPR